MDGAWNPTEPFLARIAQHNLTYSAERVHKGGRADGHSWRIKLWDRTSKALVCAGDGVSHDAAAQVALNTLDTSGRAMTQEQASNRMAELEALLAKRDAELAATKGEPKPDPAASFPAEPPKRGPGRPRKVKEPVPELVAEPVIDPLDLESTIRAE